VRNDGVLADVFGNVLLRVVRPHLLLVDVLLKDVAENVGVDFFAAGKRAVVQMPVPGVEESEQAFEGLVGHVDARVGFFQFVQ